MESQTAGTRKRTYTAQEVLTAYAAGERNFAGASIGSFPVGHVFEEGWGEARQRLAARNLSGANLQGSNFNGADLQYVDLERANLSGVNFSGANLYAADITGASLKDADLSAITGLPSGWQGASFHGANFTGTQISSGSHDQVAAVLEAALLRDNPSAERRRNREKAIAFIRSKRGSGLCWDGMVRYFRRAAPTELRWGIEMLQNQKYLHSTAGRYHAEATYLVDVLEGEKLPPGELSVLKKRSHAILLDMGSDGKPQGYTRVSIRKIYPSGAIEVATSEDEEDTLYFRPDGSDIHGKTNDYRLALPTKELREQAQRIEILTSLRYAPFRHLPLKTLRSVAELVREDIREQASH